MTEKKKKEQEAVFDGECSGEVLYAGGFIPHSIKTRTLLLLQSALICQHLALVLLQAEIRFLCVSNGVSTRLKEYLPK